MNKAQMKFLMSKKPNATADVFDEGVARARRENPTAWDAAVAGMTPKAGAEHRAAQVRGEASLTARGGK